MLTQDPQVSSDTDRTKKRFGRSGELKIAGKMFTFLSRDRLMKEWIAVGPDFLSDWPTLATEAKAFVSSKV